MLGEVLAKQLARLGAKLILSARNEAELERVREQLLGTSLFQKLNNPVESFKRCLFSCHLFLLTL